MCIREREPRREYVKIEGKRDDERLEQKDESTVRHLHPQNQKVYMQTILVVPEGEEE